LHPL